VYKRSATFASGQSNLAKATSKLLPLTSPLGYKDRRLLQTDSARAVPKCVYTVYDSDLFGRFCAGRQDVTD